MFDDEKKKERESILRRLEENARLGRTPVPRKPARAASEGDHVGVPGDSSQRAPEPDGEAVTGHPGRTVTPLHHPQPGDKGEKIGIQEPSVPTGLETWADHEEISTVVPGGALPISLNGVAFAPWSDVPRSLAEWADVEGQDHETFLAEPDMPVVKGKSPSAGVIVEEPDGRVWVVHPTNAFGGYKATFPKGGMESLSGQAAAIKEAFEESGLKVAITGYVGDVERTTTVTRYYRARRVGGTPAAMGWESQAVSLVPREDLTKVLNNPVDHDLAKL